MATGMFFLEQEDPGALFKPQHTKLHVSLAAGNMVKYLGT
jgi:hypothetical protein